MFVIVRTDDAGRCTTVDNVVRMGTYAACRVLDEVHARYAHLEERGECTIERDADTVLRIVWADGREYQYSVHGLMAAEDAPTLASVMHA